MKNALAAILVIAIIVAACLAMPRAGFGDPCRDEKYLKALAAFPAPPAMTPLDWSQAAPEVDYEVERGVICESEYGAFVVPVTITKTETRTIRGKLHFGPDGWGFAPSGNE